MVVLTFRFSKKVCYILVRNLRICTCLKKLSHTGAIINHDFNNDVCYVAITGSRIVIFKRNDNKKKISQKL